MKALFRKFAARAVANALGPDRNAEGDLDTNFAQICRLAPGEALSRLSTGEDGLAAGRAAELLAVHGRNEISRADKVPVWLAILRRFKNPLVIQLLIIGTISLLMGDIKAAVVVSGMVLLSVALAHFQESRSDAAVERLRAMVTAGAVVKRDGREEEIPIAELVPGDLVCLSAGAIVPADIRIISAKDFFVSQSSLTGESMPVEKPADAGQREKQGLLDLQNACFLGSTVVSGSAAGIVVNTGKRTYLGRISERLMAQQIQTSFDKGIASFTWLMIRFMVTMVGLVFFIVGLTKGDWVDALLFGMAVAVGLTPEMLPMIVTVNLSKGAMTMSRKKVIVKRLNAIQNFGAIDILCTDKTGTITQDRVILERHVDVTNRPCENVLRYAYMNSYYQTGLRNLLDRAVLKHTDLDVDRTCRKVDEIPFDFQRRRMSVVIDYEDAHVLICKGAVEEMFKACDQYQIDDEIYPLMDIVKRDILEQYETLSADGYRVLVIAYREFPKEKQTFSVADESGLILLGYLAFLDPPKDSTAQALKSLAKAGVAVKILTGDNALVTRKVCREVGLEVETVITGEKLDGLSPEQLADIAEANAVFAKLSPTQKEDIIRALRDRGHVVGFLGDGINDVPSLRAADIGISVDTAVDVAKESADIVLLDKSLLVLEEGIMEGRRVFSNIIKYIRMGASSNFGNMFSVVGGSYFLPFLPMAPVQILTNNLLYDISQTAIPSDRVDDELIAKPRSWNIEGIKKFMIVIGPISSIFDYATYFLMLYFFHCRDYANPSTPEAMKSYYEQLFHTGWFVESLLTQTMIVHIIRTSRIPVFQSAASMGMTLTTLAVMAVGSILPYTPVASFLGMVPLPGIYWAWIALFLFLYAVMTHGAKVWYHNRYGVY